MMGLDLAGLGPTVWALSSQLARIFYFVVSPILMLVAVGYLVQRKMGLDQATLSRLNFYFVMPALVYYSVVTADLRSGDLVTAALFGFAMIACMGGLTLGFSFLWRVAPSHRNTMLMTTMFHNSGNYGLPLQELAFRSVGLANEAVMLQVFVLLVQNISTFTLGVWLAASGKKGGHWRKDILYAFKFPPIYALGAAFLTVAIRKWLGDSAHNVGEALRPFWDVVGYVRGALFAVAIFTMGAQVAVPRSGGQGYHVRLSVFLRLMAAPALAVGLIYVMGLRGLLAQVLLISTATPTAVNCMLLCLEFDNNPGYAAKAVLYSMLISPVTVTLVIFFAQGNFLSPLKLM